MNIIKYEYGFIFESLELMEVVKDVKSQNVDFGLWKVELWQVLSSNVIWISEKWMWVHARKVKIVQDEQNGKKLKCWLFDFD